MSTGDFVVNSQLWHAMEMPETMGEMRGVWCAGGPSVPVACMCRTEHLYMQMLDEVGRWLGLEGRGSW